MTHHDQSRDFAPPSTSTSPATPVARLAPRRGALTRRLQLAPLAALLSLFAAGCRILAVDWTTCTTDADCASGVCGPTGHCQTCSAEDGCVPSPSCAVAGCGGAASVGCSGDVDCAAGQACVSGECATVPSCTHNADCAAAEVCARQQCTLVGACVGDWHCGCNAPTCTDHECSGESTCGAGGTAQPMSCGITADCPEKFYCVGQQCVFATECTEHAHCPPDTGCFRGACWPI